MATVAPAPSTRHQDVLQAVKAKPAKAHLKNLQADQEDAEDRATWGAVLKTVPEILHLSDKEFAARLGVSASQLGAWFNGSENAAMWRFHRDPEVNRALLVAQGKASGDVKARVLLEVAL